MIVSHGLSGSRRPQKELGASLARQARRRSPTRINKLTEQAIVDVGFDDMVERDGRVVFHPDLTTHISPSQWVNLYNGMAFALRLGMVMNVHITVVYGRLGVFTDQAAHELLEDFNQALYKKAESAKLPWSYAYAHENARDEGLHTHLLTLWPQADHRHFAEWVHGYFAERTRATAYDSAAVCVRHRRDGSVDRHWRWFGYLTKGTDPDYVARDLLDSGKWHSFGDLMLRHHEYRGIVRLRKRVGLSRNIDRSAQKEFVPFPEVGTRPFISPFRAGESTKQTLYTDKPLRDYEAARQVAQVYSGLSSLGGF